MTHEIRRSFSVTPAIVGLFLLLLPFLFWVLVSFVPFFVTPSIVYDYLFSLPSFFVVTITVYFPVLAFVMGIAAFREVFTRRDISKNLSMLIIALSLFFLATVFLWLSGLVFG